MHRHDTAAIEVNYDEINREVDFSIDYAVGATTAASEFVETIELEVRVIGLVEQIWAANLRLCTLGGADNRAAAFTALYQLHQPLAGLRGRIADLDPVFRYEHLASCAE